MTSQRTKKPMTEADFAKKLEEFAASGEARYEAHDSCADCPEAENERPCTCERSCVDAMREEQA